MSCEHCALVEKKKTKDSLGVATVSFVVHSVALSNRCYVRLFYCQVQQTCKIQRGASCSNEHLYPPLLCERKIYGKQMENFIFYRYDV